MRVNRQYINIFIFNHNLWAQDWLEDRIDELEEEGKFNNADDEALEEFIETVLDPMSDEDLVKLAKKTEQDYGGTIGDYLLKEYFASEDDYLDPATKILEV